MLDSHQCCHGPYFQQDNVTDLRTEYFAATSPTQGPTYTDYGVGKLFACTCTIPNSEIVFGGTSNTFPSKKAAHANAAREAFQSLIEAGLVEPDGSLKAKKKAKVGTAVKIENQGIGVRKNTTYAQKANGKYLSLPL